MNGGRVESCSRIKGGNGRLAVGEDEVRSILNDYFKGLYKMDAKEHTAVHKYGLVVIGEVIVLKESQLVVHRVRRVTEGVINDEEEGFGSGMGFVIQIFTPKQKGEGRNRGFM